MGQDQLREHITQQRQAGKSDAQIKEELLKVGWQAVDVDDALSVGNSQTFAGFWIRFLALLVDQTIFIIIALGLGIILKPFTSQVGEESLSSVAAWVDAFIAPFLIVAYNVLFVWLKGATPGKMLVGLKIVKIDGSAVDLGAALLREIIGKAASGLLFGLGYFWVAFDKKKQGWHDKLAKTVVVRKTHNQLLVRVLAAVLFVGLVIATIVIYYSVKTSRFSTYNPGSGAYPETDIAPGGFVPVPQN